MFRTETLRFKVQKNSSKYFSMVQGSKKKVRTPCPSSDRYQGCTGSCGLFHPILCKNSTRLKECFLPDCTLTHLSGTQRKRERTPTSNRETRYFYNHNIQDSRDFSNAYSNNRNFQPSFLPERVINNSNYSIPSQNRVRDEFAYHQKDFPKLLPPEDLSQFSKDIRQLKDGIGYLLQSKNYNQPKPLFEPREYSSNETFPVSHRGKTYQPKEAKNFLPQNQFYPRQDHWEQ